MIGEAKLNFKTLSKITLYQFKANDMGMQADVGFYPKILPALAMDSKVVLREHGKRVVPM